VVIRLSKSCIGDSEKQAVMRVLDSEHLGMGNEVKEFEEALTNFFGRPTVCVSSGTAALHLALQAVGIGAGDEVLVQSLTYVASFQAISATGAKPVACDIDPQTLCLDWKDAEKKITPNTKGVMPVHYSGGVGALNEIYDFAKYNNLRVIEDAAHAFGTEYCEKKIGAFGDIACFSFDGIKNITSGEGGCVVSNDKIVLNRVRDARLLGVEKDTEKRYTRNRSWSSNVVLQGWRYHMSNIMAAIGKEQLKRFDYFKQKRKELAKLYNDLLINIDGLSILNYNNNNIVPHIYVIKLSDVIDRDNIRKKLNDNGIETGVHYLPNHLLTFYNHLDNIEIKNVDSVYPSLLSLPIHPDLVVNDVEYICYVLINAISKDDKIRNN
jgi:dTDP-4-amino-4,6-dideoxygalactose transaminase